LKSYIYDAVAQCRSDALAEHDIIDRLRSGQMPVHQASPPAAPSSLASIFGQFPTLVELTDYAVENALEATGNNQSEAAKMLGISKQALSKRLKKKKKTRST
jgi:DNA-binding NtrC family response regulator